MSPLLGSKGRFHSHHLQTEVYGGINLSICPVDYQIVVNKTGDLSKDANLIRSRSDIQQFQFSEELQRKKIRDEKKVLSTTKTEHKKIGKKEQRDKRQLRKQEHNRDFDEPAKNKSEKEDASIISQGSKIDIRI